MPYVVLMLDSATTFAAVTTTATAATIATTGAATNTVTEAGSGERLVEYKT